MYIFSKFYSAIKKSPNLKVSFKTSFTKHFHFDNEKLILYDGQGVKEDIDIS